MPPRASWTGHLRLSLVSFPVRMYNATSSTARISLNQLHKDCGQRLKQQMVCPEHGEVSRDDIVKGYEFEKGRFVVIGDADLEKIELETDKVLEVLQFIDANELDTICLSSPYFMAPDGPVAEHAFVVIRDAMRKTNKVAIGRVVMHGKEQIFAVRPKDKGLLLTTLKSATEVRGSEAYFEDIRDADVSKDELKLAEQLITNSTAPFNLAEFKDRYEEALMEVINSKIAGKEPIFEQREEVAKVINLMDALKQSVAQATKKKPPAKKAKPDAAAPAKRKKKGA